MGGSSVVVGVPSQTVTYLKERRGWRSEDDRRSKTNRAEVWSDPPVQVKDDRDARGLSQRSTGMKNMHTRPRRCALDAQWIAKPSAFTVANKGQRKEGEEEAGGYVSCLFCSCGEWKQELEPCANKSTDTSESTIWLRLIPVLGRSLLKAAWGEISSVHLSESDRYQ